MMAYPMQPITIDGDVTLNRETHSQTLLVFDVASGATVTLPDAVGSGDTYKFFVTTTVTSNNYVIQAPDADNVIQGAVGLATDVSGVTVPTTTTSDTITMNGSTTGGVIGSYVELRDADADTWMVTGTLVSTGTEATPFSAAVS